MWQGGPIRPPGSVTTIVVYFRTLFRRECLGRPEHHAASIVHDHIDTSFTPDDLGDRGIHRILQLNIQVQARDPQALVCGDSAESA